MKNAETTAPVLKPALLMAPVVEVTVTEDRARVVRRGAFSAAAGRVLLAIGGCSPLISDKTLSAALVSGPRGAKVADARVRRFLRERLESRPEDLAASQRRLIEAGSRCAELETARDSLESAIEALSAAFGLTASEIADDASFGRVDPDRWKRMLDGIAKNESEARFAKSGKEAELAKQEKIRSDLEATVGLLKNPGSTMGAVIEVEAASEEPGDCTIEVSYMVPCACWRPAHTVAMIQGSGKCRVSTDAFLWQFTGEDWADAWISFSTQRPSLGTKPPILSEDVVVAQDRRDRVEVEARDQEVQTAGPGGSPARRAHEMPGIDDGGSVFSIRAPSRATVKSDGAPHRVPLGSFESPAKTALICMPEVAAAAVTRLESSNSSSLPVLAGPVDLVGESGFVGRTSTLFVAPGERFELGFGPDPDVRVFRKIDRVDREKSMLSKWIRSIVTVTLNLSNIGQAARKFRLTERVPVSEIEQVRVEFDDKECVPPAKQDENGFLNWDVELPGFGKKTVRFSYAIDRTGEVTGL